MTQEIKKENFFKKHFILIMCFAIGLEIGFVIGDIYADIRHSHQRELRNFIEICVGDLNKGVEISEQKSYTFNSKLCENMYENKK